MTDLVPAFVGLGKAIVGSNPIGSTILAVANEYAQQAHERAIARADQMLQERIDQLGTRVDVECVKTEQFADLYKNCRFITLRTQHEEKFRAAANILGNAALRQDDLERLSFDELDHFSRCVENLSIPAIRILGAVLERGRIQDRRRSDNELSTLNVKMEFAALRRDVGDIDADFLLGLLGELNAVNLVHIRALPGVGFGDGDRKYANYPIETTPLGYRFKRYILDPQPSD